MRLERGPELDCEGLAAVGKTLGLILSGSGSHWKVFVCLFV